MLITLMLWGVIHETALEHDWLWVSCCMTGPGYIVYLSVVYPPTPTKKFCEYDP